MLNNIYIIKDEVKCLINAKRYENFIISRIKINLTRDFTNIKFDKHHIIPKSMGGTDDENNIIKLTYREHFIAHLLLSRLYQNNKMTYAFYRMKNKTNNSKLYESYKNKFIESISGENAYWYGKPKYLQPMYGKKLSKNAKLKISIANKGDNNYWRHHQFSEEHKKKLSESRTGDKNPNYNREFSDEHKRKISNSKLGSKHSDETKEKISNAVSGKNNPRYGVIVSDETKKKMSESLKGRKNSKESIEKQAAKLRGKKLSDEIKQKISEGKMHLYSIEGKIYNGREEISKIYGISQRTVLNRCISKKYKDWFKIEKKK